MAGSGNDIALGCGEPDQLTLTLACDAVDPPYDIQCAPGRVAAGAGKSLGQRGTNGRLLISDDVADQRRTMRAQPFLGGHVPRTHRMTI